MKNSNVLYSSSSLKGKIKTWSKNWTKEVLGRVFDGFKVKRDESNMLKAFRPLQSSTALWKYVNNSPVRLTAHPSSCCRCFVNHSSESGATEEEFYRKMELKMILFSAVL